MPTLRKLDELEDAPWEAREFSPLPSDAGQGNYHANNSRAGKKRKVTPGSVAAKASAALEDDSDDELSRNGDDPSPHSLEPTGIVSRTPPMAQQTTRASTTPHRQRQEGQWQTDVIDPHTAKLKRKIVIYSKKRKKGASARALAKYEQTGEVNSHFDGEAAQREAVPSKKHSETQADFFFQECRSTAFVGGKLPTCNDKKSAYELLREKKIARNNARLKALGLLPDVETQNTNQRGRKAKRTKAKGAANNASSLPMRRSARLQKLVGSDQSKNKAKSKRKPMSLQSKLEDVSSEESGNTARKAVGPRLLARASSVSVRGANVFDVEISPEAKRVSERKSLAAAAAAAAAAVSGRRDGPSASEEIDVVAVNAQVQEAARQAIALGGKVPSPDWRIHSTHDKRRRRDLWVLPSTKIQFNKRKDAFEFEEFRKRLPDGSSALAAYKEMKRRLGEQPRVRALNCDLSQEEADRSSGEGAEGGSDQEAEGDPANFHADEADECYVCEDGGELVCCDFCPKAFHMNCHIPRLQLDSIPPGAWKCMECLASTFKRKQRCGVCRECKRPDCGKCCCCRRKKSFGGDGKWGMPCKLKRCKNMRFASTEKPKAKFKAKSKMSTKRKPAGDQTIAVSKKPLDPMTFTMVQLAKGRPVTPKKPSPGKGWVYKLATIAGDAQQRYV